MRGAANITYSVATYGEHSPWEALSVMVEEEPGTNGTVERVFIVFLTGSRCRWKCVMCDLRDNMIPEPIPPGAIPAQIAGALDRLKAYTATGAFGAIKLYNSGSFFDERSVPRIDYPRIATLVQRFPKVIVECHPRLVGPLVLEFRDHLAGKLEVALGLEISDDEVLAKLRKGFTIAQYAQAAEFLVKSGVDVRAFVLIQPPFVRPEIAVEKAVESVGFAFDCGASIVSLNPTRMGNRKLKLLAAQGKFCPPRLSVIEKSLECALRLRKGRVIADLWSINEFADCDTCFHARCSRLKQMNLTQSPQPAVLCHVCGSR